MQVQVGWWLHAFPRQTKVCNAFHCHPPSFLRTHRVGMASLELSRPLRSPDLGRLLACLEAA